MQFPPKYNSLHDYKLDFVEASSSPFTTIFKRFTKNNVFPVDNLVNFINHNLPNILYSTGNFITQKKDYKKILDGVKTGSFQAFMNREVNMIRGVPWFKETPLVIDSGGHQLIMGHLKRIDHTIIDEYSEAYFTWLKNKTTANMGFSLDIHADKPMVDHAKHLYELNQLSISNMLDIMDESLEKIIWVYQFRSKNLNKLWLKLSEEFEIYKKLNKHSIGGVAQFSKVGSIKFPIYIPPAVITLANLMEYNTHDYHVFHILGVMNPTDLIQFALIQRGFARYHNFNVHVTLDSSKIFSAQSVAAHLEFLINNHLYKISFASRDLNKKSHIKGYTNEQVLRYLFKQLDEKWGFNEPEDTRFYIENKQGGYSFNKAYWSKIILLSYIHLNKLIEINLQVADELLDLFDQGKYHKFNKRLHMHQSKMNVTGLSPKLIEKSQNFKQAIELIKSADKKQAEVLIDRLFPELEIFS